MCYFLILMAKKATQRKNRYKNNQQAYGGYAASGFYRVTVLNTVFAILILFYILLTLQRNHIWREPIYMWLDIIKKTPTKSRVFNNLANGLSELGRFDEAIRAYETALKIEPDMEQAHYSMGVAFGKMGRKEDAKRKYADALKIDFNYPEAHMNLGNILKDEKKFAEAEKAYRTALKQDPYYGECYSNLGVLYAMVANAYRQQKNDALKNKYINMATENYVLAKKYNPRFAGSYSNHAALYGAQGKYEEAIVEIKKTLELDPNHSDALFNLALTYVNLKDFETAEATLTDMITRFPNHERAKGLLANLDKIKAKSGF